MRAPLPGLIPRNLVPAAVPAGRAPQGFPRPMTGDEQSLFKGLFPSMDTEAAAVSAPATSDYNCISWTVGEAGRWYWPPRMFTGALALVGDISKSTTEHTATMNAVEGFFGVGAIIGPALVAWLLALGVSWEWFYVIAGTLCVVLILAALCAKYPGKSGREEEPVKVGRIVRMVGNPYALGFSMAAFLNSKGISCFPRAQHGSVAGVILFFTAAAAALGPLAMGAVSDHFGSLRYGFILATILAGLLSAGLVANWVFKPAGERLRRLEGSEYAPHDVAVDAPATKIKEVAPCATQ